jgi:hypothetical protein
LSFLSVRLSTIQNTLISEKRMVKSLRWNYLMVVICSVRWFVWDCHRANNYLSIWTHSTQFYWQIAGITKTIEYILLVVLVTVAGGGEKTRF